MSSLRDRLGEFKRTLESGAPPYNATREAVATMHRATAELKASGIESAALKVGDRAPDFSLFNQDHVRVTARYIIDSSSIIRAADVNADYTIRPEPSDTLSLLRTLEAFDAAHG